MCNLYGTTDADHLRTQLFLGLDGLEWDAIVAPLGRGVFILQNRRAQVGQWGMIPPSSKERTPKTREGRRLSTNNASGALLTVRSGKSACSHDLVTVSCGSGRSDCLNWR